MENRDIMPDGLIGEEGVGFSRGFWPNAILTSITVWLVIGITAVTAVRLIHWIFRG